MARQLAAALTPVARGLTPVKGTPHLSLPALDLGIAGPAADRRWCLVDPEARRVLRTVQHPTLMQVVARYDEGVLSLAAEGRPGLQAPAPETGERATFDYWGRPVELDLCTGPHAAWLSDHLGRQVRLARAAPGGVIYGAPVTLVTTASLEALA